MVKVEIYSSQACPYCVRAKQLLDKKSVAYSEIRVDLDEAARDIMLDRSGGRRSVPQIFINGQHVGGCDDLYALEHKGELDGMLEP